MNQHLRTSIAVAVLLLAQCVPGLAQLEAEKPPKANAMKEEPVNPLLRQASLVLNNAIGPALRDGSCQEGHLVVD